MYEPTVACSDERDRKRDTFSKRNIFPIINANTSKMNQLSITRFTEDNELRLNDSKIELSLLHMTYIIRTVPSIYRNL